MTHFQYSFMIRWGNSFWKKKIQNRNPLIFQNWKKDSILRKFLVALEIAFLK